MMRCDTCSHEYTTVDFITLRNLCEHIYLDSLAQKRLSSLAGPHTAFLNLNFSQPGAPAK
jgi:hypothetical protein